MTKIISGLISRFYASLPQRYAVSDGRARYDASGNAGQREVIILDVTRMREDRICVAGVYLDEEKKYREIRPVASFGNLTVGFLSRSGGGVIEPFTVVRFKFSRAVEQPPHVEDFVMNDRAPRSVEIIGKLGEENRARLLEEISVDSIEKIFGENLVDGKYIYENEPGKSLGCLKVDRVDGIYIKDMEGKLRIRAGFRHGGSPVYYTVVERRLFAHVSSQLEAGEKAAEVESILRRKLRRAEKTFLRFGLARPHRFDDDPDADDRKKCYVQILGIHTFPDFLK